METSGIKTIIFDLGGVILNIDYQRTILEFTKISGFPAESIYTQQNQHDLFDSFEKGQISENEFLTQLSQILNEKNLEKIIFAWNAMLLDFPAPRMRLLEKVKNNYHTFLFSNTNSIHLKAFEKILFQSHQINSLSVFFQKDYYSHLLGKRKPDPESFQYILKKHNLNPSETLFIDDSLQHIQGAKQVGLNTYWLKKENEILDLFEENGKLKSYLNE